MLDSRTIDWSYGWELMASDRVRAVIFDRSILMSRNSTYVVRLAHNLPKRHCTIRIF